MQQLENKLRKYVKDGAWNPRVLLTISLLSSLLVGGFLFAINEIKLKISEKKIYALPLSLFFWVIYVYLVFLWDYKYLRIITIGLHFMIPYSMYKDQIVLYKKYIASGKKKGTQLELIKFFIIVLLFSILSFILLFYLYELFEWIELVSE